MSEDMTVTDLIERSYGTAKEKGWWDDNAGADRSFGTALMLMVSELAEALEEYRQNRALDEIWYADSGKPEGIPVELADTIIRIADLCGHYNIPLVRALTEKMAYNKTRPYRHGNKKA